MHVHRAPEIIPTLFGGGLWKLIFIVTLSIGSIGVFPFLPLLQLLAVVVAAFEAAVIFPWWFAAIHLFADLKMNYALHHYADETLNSYRSYKSFASASVTPRSMVTRISDV